MALKVSSPVGPLVYASMSQVHASKLAPRMIGACMSFYFEPDPFDHCHVVFAEEHRHVVHNLLINCRIPVEMNASR